LDTPEPWHNRQRATSANLKQQRKQNIVDTAWELFGQTSYNNITIAQVAEKTGLAKGTVYLYFKTKEELFLAVQHQQFENWFDELDQQVINIPSGNIRQIADLVADTLAERPVFVRLLAILHTILEQNIEFESANQFKRMLLGRVARTGTTLENLLPYFHPGQGPQALFRIYALIIGLYQMTDTSPVITQVLAQPELNALTVNFKAELADTIEILLKGYSV
jgi:AcrR family transcriptional regulator